MLCRRDSTVGIPSFLQLFGWLPWEVSNLFDGIHDIVISVCYYRVLIAGIKFLGHCPCPQCLVEKSDLPTMGMVRDMRCHIKKPGVDDDDRRHHIAAARHLIFKKGAAVDSERVRALLNEFSYVPTFVSANSIVHGTPSWQNLQNAFSNQLHWFRINFFKLLVVDMLHEFELGVWKAIFTHLLCILYAAGGRGIQELNKRYDYWMIKTSHLT